MNQNNTQAAIKALNRFSTDVVEKATGHKYIRREGSAATGYRYVYSDGPQGTSRVTGSTRFAEDKHPKVKPVLADLDRLSRKVHSVRGQAGKYSQEGDRGMASFTHRDADRLTAFHQAVVRGNLAEAREHYRKMDTAVSDHIPARLLNYVHRQAGRR